MPIKSTAPSTRSWWIRTVSRGKLQLYGTQFKFENNAMTMDAVEDPTGLDARRAKVMLMPVEAYKEMLSSEYHMKTTDGSVARSK
jgi:hypothetical protein